MKKSKTTGGLRTATRVGRTLLVILALMMNLLPVPASVFAQEGPVITTDKQDYAPEETVIITGAGFSPNAFYAIPVVRPDGDIVKGDGSFTPGWDLVETLGDGSFTYPYQLDGILGTYWVYVYDSSWSGDLSEPFLAYTTFTDAIGSFSKPYAHWSDEPLPGDWNNNILNDNKSNYFEGEVIPHVFMYGASNNAQLVNGQSYSFNVTYNWYQDNTDAGGFAYMTQYNLSRQPTVFNWATPAITPIADNSFTNGGGMHAGSFFTVDADITNVSAVTYTGTGTKDGHVTITFTYTGATTGSGYAAVYYGLYVAKPGEVPDQGKGKTNGANAWTGGSLQTTVDIGGSGATSIQLAPAAIIAGEISGLKFNDLNGNGTKDTGEPGLAGWTICLDSDSDPNNGNLGCVLTSNGTTDDQDGNGVIDPVGFYYFSVTPGTYYVYEVNKTGWTQTAPSTVYYGPLVVSATTSTYLDKNFGNAFNTGSLKISKTVSNPDGATVPTSFLVDYNCGSGYTGQVSVAPGSPATVSGIPTGNVCTVTEVAPTPIPGYTWGTIIYTPASVTIGTNTTVEIVVANSITRDRGSFKITKSTNNPDGATLPTFTGTYDCGTGYTGNWSVVDGGSQTISGIPTGNTCTVTEDALAPITDYTWGTPTFTPASIVISTKDQTFEIVVGNSITRDRGSLTIVKKVVNDDGGTATVSAFSITTSADTLTFDGGVADGTTTTYTSQKITVVTGDYTLQEIDVTGYSEGTWSCVNGTANPTDYDNGSVYVGKDKDVVCTIINDDIAPTLKLVKEVDNGVGEVLTLGPNDWTLWALADEPNHGRNFSTAGGSGTFVTVFANAGYALSESTVAGYQIKTDWVCTGGGTQVGNTITLGLDEDVTCTIVNEALGQADLTKLTQGELYPHDVWGTMTWNFTLTGPGVNATDTAPPSEVDFGGVYLIPGEEYVLCETGIGVGWTLEWKGDGGDGGAPDTIIPMVANVNSAPVDPATGYSQVYDPNYVLSPGVYTNDTRCVKFVVGVGQTKEFSIDNQYPGGEPRTIGFWKNWNTCTGGGQADTAAANGGPDAGWYILDDLLNDPGYTIGILELGGEDCETAVAILGKSDISNGKLMASDAAYNMAAQLLGAELNLSAGAETCQEIVDAVNDGQNLLAAIGFDGTGGYLRPNTKDKDLYYYANDLAVILDTYNNGNLCGEGGVEPPPPPDEGYLHVSALSGEGTSGKPGRWTATWTVGVQDQGGNSMEGALVSGVLSGDATGGANCTTGTDGTCAITKANLKDSVSSVTFTVTGISLGDYIYDPEGYFGPADDLSEYTITHP